MGTGIIRTCCILVLALYCAFRCFAEEEHQKLPSAVDVVGKVFCDTCFNQHLSKSSRFVSGASVAVECRNDATRLTFRKEIQTNRNGAFKVRIPRGVVSREFSEIKGCSVKLISSNEPFCSVASSATSSELRLKSKRNGMPLFSAGFLTFRPPKQPEFCNRERKPVTERKQVLPPPIPFVPSPPLIPMPPNPLQPPPSVLPPIIPSPPPSVLPPIIPSPPPSLFPPILPPVPFFSPLPPPPASVFPPFPIPLPPNPFFPGNPPPPRK